MVKVAILGQGMVGTHFVVGLERLKNGEIEPYGVPLAEYKMPYGFEEIEVVASYDVDEKVGTSVYDIAKKVFGDQLEIPRTLKDLVVERGIHLGSLRGLSNSAVGLEDKMGLEEAIGELVEDWKSKSVEVIVNVITTEPSKPFNNVESLEKAIRSNLKEEVSASHAYAYACALLSREKGRAAFINVIPSTLANDWSIIKLYRESGGVVLGDDGATGATPLTSDLLEHLAERNRRVKHVVQFNIGGNTDFLALTIPERNLMKEKTKSSIVEDILGYNAPHYIKPTGYLEPLGDKKFIAMNLEYISFNGFVDELYIVGRINDSPALAGKLVDLVRLGKIALDYGIKGTVYEINAFYMKKPGPPNSKSISKIVAFHNLIRWLEGIGAIVA